MHSENTHRLLTCALCLAVGACASGSATEEPYESPPPAATAGDEMSDPAQTNEVVGPEPAPTTGEPEPAAKPAEPPPPPTPTVGALVVYKVKDFDAWKAKFDEQEPARIEAGLIGHGLSTDADKKNNVILYIAASDIEALKAYTESKDAKTAMKEAGVIGKPKITLMTHGESNPAKSAGATAMFNYRVKDFDTWKKAFDESAPERNNAGIIGYSISQGAADDKLVYVYLQADELETLRKYAKSPELKEAMKEAGLKSKPMYTFMEPGEIKFYTPPQQEAAEGATPAPVPGATKTEAPAAPGTQTEAPAENPAPATSE